VVVDFPAVGLVAAGEEVGELQIINLNRYTNIKAGPTNVGPAFKFNF
jgi:hypothetical protein